MKKGFTLVEMLAVIVIIGIIATIAFISTTAVANSSKEKAYNTKIASIESAAIKYIQDNPREIPSGGTISVSVTDLLDAGYIVNDKNSAKDNKCPSGSSSCVINPKDTSKELTTCEVSIKVKNKRYKATFNAKVC